MTDAGFMWSQQTVTKTENGRRPIRLNEVDALARVFGVPIAALVDPGATVDSSTRIAGVDRATTELEDLRRSLDAQLARLQHERIDLDVEQAQARWRAQQEG
jgi:transcriptional regulator with XRE-family HTH domain